MKIAFWSPLHGTGASSGLIAMATAISVIYSEKTVVTQTHYNLNNLERPLLGSSDKIFQIRKYYGRTNRKLLDKNE